MTDIVERLQGLKANLSNADLQVLEDMLGTVTEAIATIKHYRALAGAVSPGQNFRDIAENVPSRRSDHEIPRPIDQDKTPPEMLRPTTP